MHLGIFRYFVETHEVIALYTYHNNEDCFDERQIVREAEKNHIPVYMNKPTEEEILSFYDHDGVEMLFSAEYAYIIPVPNLPNLKGINIHSSFLPEGRSYYPIECAMERGLNYTGVTLHKLDPKIDAGDILAQERIMISPEDDSIDVYLYAIAAAERMTKAVFSDLDRAWKVGVKQSQKLPYWRRPEEKKLKLCHEMTVDEARDIYRKYNQMTEVDYNGKTYHIVTFAAGNAGIGEKEIPMNDNMVFFGVKNGHLRLTLLEKYQNKKEEVRK